MHPQLQLLKSTLIGVKAQVDADRGKSTLIVKLNKLQKRLESLDTIGQPPNRDNVVALIAEAQEAIDAYNASNQITTETAEAILAQFDALA